MTNQSLDIWFWQRIVTPHMAGLAIALAQQGHLVTYVAERLMSKEREKQGWLPPVLHGVDLKILPDKISVANAICEASIDSIHICQGIRGNGLVAAAQKGLRKRRLKQWVIMETVNDQGPDGLIKRLTYQFLFKFHGRHIQGVLANGWRTAEWIRSRGVHPEKTFPFCYFLPEAEIPAKINQETPPTFRFLFVGSFIEIKRLDLLVEALLKLKSDNDLEFQLQVIGSGPLENDLRNKAEKLLGERLMWTGLLSMEKVRHAMTIADCLVLPSRHDGWGAVVSEALMAGTPAIVSDACGSAGVVKASGVGGVFPSGNEKALQDSLQEIVSRGKVSTEQRKQLASWAKCLGADAGACYLQQILCYTYGNGDRPTPPWEESPIKHVVA